MKKIAVLLVGIFLSLSLVSCDLNFSDPNVIINTIEDESTEKIQVQNQISETIKKVSRYCVGIYTTNGTTASIGSGVVYRIIDLETNDTATESTKEALCYVVTNEHVIASESTNVKYKVYMGNDTYYHADIVGSDATNDIAVLTFQVKLGDDTIKYNEFADIFSDEMSMPAPGSYAIAIGCPLSLDNYNYPTVGLVGKVTLKTITHSALINPGNSGGGLFDTSGRLMGLNVRKSTVIVEPGENGEDDIVPIEGIGEAIPIWTLKTVINDIENLNKVVVRPSLGVEVYNANASLYDEHRDVLPNTMSQGVVVNNVTINGNASKMNGEDNDGIKYLSLEKGDVIAKVNDENIKRSEDLGYYLSIAKPGDTMKLTIYRNINNSWKEINFSGKLS